MKSLLALIVAAALAVPLLGCEANVDADGHPGRGRAVGHDRHDRDADVELEADVPDVDVEGSVDVD